MPTNFINLVRRDAAVPVNHTLMNLLVVLLVLLIIALSLVGALLVFRQRKRARRTLELPLYSEKRISTASSHSNHRRVMIRPSESIHIYHEKQNLIDNSSAPPSPSLNQIPEIRITFPEEVDATGKRTSGRVVVVRVGDTTVGLEPVPENLPSYAQDGERFQSLDLDRIGGLEEKPQKMQWN